MVTIQLIYICEREWRWINESFVFNVDTTAPTLLLKSPTNGSGFDENGTLNVSGITERCIYYRKY